MKNKNNLKWNTLFLAFITIIVLYFVLKDDFNNIVDTLLKVDLKFILIAVVLYFLYIAIRAYKIYITVNDKKKFTLWESIKHNIITQFFNGVTPFSSGGQPMEIYMLTKHKISFPKASNYIILNFMFYQIALVIYGTIAVLYNFVFDIFPNSPFLKKLIFLGFVINALVALLLLFVASSAKFTHKCMNMTVSLLDKINLVKDKKAVCEKWNSKLEEFHSSTKDLFKNKSRFVLGVVLNLISLTCFYVIPLFVVYSFHDFTSLNVMDSIVASAYVLIIGSFVPIPGASGGIEYGFLKFFGNFISGSRIVATLLIWRVITYYLGVIVGGILVNFDKGAD